MKTEFKPGHTSKGLYIPPEISERTSLRDSASLDVYSNDKAMVLLSRKMNARELIKTVDMLNTVATGLIMRLEQAALDFEEKCCQISIPEELLKAAGIPKGAALDIMTGEGEIFITETMEDADPLERLPGFMCEMFEESGLNFTALRFLLNSGEAIPE